MVKRSRMLCCYLLLLLFVVVVGTDFDAVFVGGVVGVVVVTVYVIA